MLMRLPYIIMNVAFDFFNAKYLWHLRGFVEYMQLLGEKKTTTVPQTTLTLSTRIRANNIVI